MKNEPKKVEKIEEQAPEISPIEALLDENNVDPIVLYDENGTEVKFEQVAIIPLDDDVYAILKPVEKTEDVGEDEAQVFKIELEDEDSEEGYLTLVGDVELIDKVFDIYYKLFEEETKKDKRKRKKS